MSKRRFRRFEHRGAIHLRTAGWGCLYCGKVNDAVSLPGVPETPKPSPGDALICIGCAQIMLVDELLNPVKPDPAQLMALRLADPAFARILDRIQAAHREAFPLS